MTKSEMQLAIKVAKEYKGSPEHLEAFFEFNGFTPKEKMEVLGKLEACVDFCPLGKNPKTCRHCGLWRNYK